ncbi:MAG: hypothetical protein EHM50_04845 [Lysobacterales bacterium]|nr:MAG: hypothetical protein EHM50_04845 [Xanthomonadales bacterium]
MSWLEFRQSLTSIAASAAAFMFAALASPHDATAAESNGHEQALLDQIQEILSRDGPYSRDLLAPLTNLGLLYQEGTDYSFALATLERAVQVVRINNGLHTLDQVPLVRQLIRIEEKRGNDSGAWDREQKLLALLRRHPDDLRTVPALREIAGKQMAVLGAVLAGERPPEVILGCFYKEWPARDDGSCHAGSKKTVVQGILAEAQRNYADAIGVMLRQGLYGSDELRALELEVLRGVDLLRTRYYHGGFDRPIPMVPASIVASSIEPWRSRMAPVAELADWELPYPGRLLEGDDTGNVVTKHLHLMDPYHRGRQSLRRLYAYGAASSGSSLSQADAVVQIADWDLLYSHNGQAVESYEVAHAMLEQAGAPSASIAQLFAPPTPIVLPAFQPNPLAKDGARDPTGHIDVAFEITKYGRGRAVEFLDAANAPENAKQRLLNLIRSNRFRPRLMDGEFADAAPVRMRYYLYDRG